MIQVSSWNGVWHQLLDDLVTRGRVVGPRGKQTRELYDVKITLDNALDNVLVSPARKLGYRFMVAEWLFIWFGRDDVKTIAHYAPAIAQFSDDGVTFAGNYGKPVHAQWPYVLGKLLEDPDSRQAVLTIWRPSPAPSKDIPCTIALQFLLRDGKLNIIATMRSSDIWLGLPYDVFNFTMLGNILAAQLGVKVGWFSIHLGSSHLYESNIEAARNLLHERNVDIVSVRSPALPAAPPHWLEHALTQSNVIGPKIEKTEIWDVYERVLARPSNYEALGLLRSLDETQPR